MNKILVAVACCFLLFPFFSRASENGIDVKKRNKLNRIFVISIGTSSKTPQNIVSFNKDSSYSLNMACETCLSDAEGLAKYIQGLKQKLPGNVDTVVAWHFNRGNATLDSLQHRFLDIQKQSRPEDVFVFYYASINWGNRLNESTGAFEGYYNLQDSKKEYDRKIAFTLGDLKVFTDRIAAKRQLIIFDTGFGDVIQRDFYKNFFSDNPSQAMFAQKERIIVGPEDMSSESIDADGKMKGDLFKVISNLPTAFNVFTLFEDMETATQKKSAYKQFMQHWFQEQQQCMVQIKVLRELQYLEILTAIKPVNTNTKRGNIPLLKQTPVDKALTQKAKRALVIGTNNYEAGLQWPSLRNAINDGEAFAALMQQQGYDVVRLFDKQQDAILEAISEFCSNSNNPYDQNVIYIAGHGYYDSRQQAGYIVCADSKTFKNGERPNASELRSYLDYTVLFRNMEQLNKVIFITDVCFGGTAMNSMMQNKMMVTPDKDASSSKNPYRRVLSSGIKEVDDFIKLQNGTASSHSPFAHALLNVFNSNKEDISFETLFSALSKARLEPKPIEFYFGENIKPNEFNF